MAGFCSLRLHLFVGFFVALGYDALGTIVPGLRLCLEFDSGWWVMERARKGNENVEKRRGREGGRWRVFKRLSPFGYPPNFSPGASSRYGHARQSHPCLYTSVPHHLKPSIQPG